MSRIFQASCPPGAAIRFREHLLRGQEKLRVR